MPQTLTPDKLTAARTWAADLAHDAHTGPTGIGWYATHHALPRALGTGPDAASARFDLRDLAYEWALGLLGAGDDLPDLA